MAVGDRNGSTTLIELSESLCKIQNNEKATFSQVRLGATGGLRCCAVALCCAIVLCG